ncbi:MAG: hypothetical protein BWZ10_02296 [candidate division BRC1 bacterium ADurb.BinA364]|nr:MAG: hypothetical protein BWZ10_02296 [candidate division BRC1 bacterium ADurb.BinA364]
MEPIEAHGDGALIRLRALPRASRTESAGVAEGRLRLRVAAAPVEGAANEAVLKYLSKRLRLPRSAIRLLRGEKSREKDVLAEGMDVAAAKAALL